MDYPWEELTPKVEEVSEFKEIARDFGDPFEIFREAISNSFDHKASHIKIDIRVESITGYDKVVILFEDDGEGMPYERIAHNFWDLGNSSSRDDPTKIGEKGHGTKIYLKSDKVIVQTFHSTGAYEAVCQSPFTDLNNGNKHKPQIRKIDAESSKHGTLIRIEGYNKDERSRYFQNIVADYLLWFTKIGSFEGQFSGRTPPSFYVLLKCLDKTEYERINFGHPFAKENFDIEQLFASYGVNAADFYVKKFEKSDRLEKFPEVEYHAVIYLEGDSAKRNYNKLLKERKSTSKGYYKVNDRYGIWLAKDFIPVEKVNDWISTFGGGAGSVGLLHGFINCQKIKLTANRGSVAQEPELLNELKKVVIDLVEDINEHMYKNSILTLQTWQKEEKTLRIEELEFKRRKENILTKKSYVHQNISILEPQNEAELFGFFVTIYTLHPDLFDFEPLDYNASLGIDVLARNKTNTKISDCEFWYVELKHLLGKAFNHSFKNIRWIICWDFDKSLKDGSILKSIVEGEERQLMFCTDDKTKETTYFLDSPSVLTKIKVIRLKEFAAARLAITF